jgi:hypothetical protein
MSQGVRNDPTDSPFGHLREKAVGFGVLLARVFGETLDSLPSSSRPPLTGPTTTPARRTRSLAEIANHVDDHLAHFFDYPSLMTRIWEEVCDEVASGNLESGRGGELLREVFTEAAELLISTRDGLIRGLEEKGFPLSRAPEFRRVAEETVRLTERYLGRWALVDPEVIAEARREHEQGDYPSLSVALADLLAAKHAERALPSYDDLKAWADQAAPPARWFEEATD